MTQPAAERVGRSHRRVIAGRLAGLFDQHASMVFGLCRLLLRDHHEAEDAAQQTFVSAYRSLLRGTQPRDAAPWLAAIARNECRARIRRRMRSPLALEGEIEELIADPTDIVEETERRAEFAALTAAIAELPLRQREAVALRDFLGLSYEEVASTLSVSVPVVESLLFRARRRLRDTVRTVPRYAAGFVTIPLAIKAAVSRELPDLDSSAASTGIAGAAFAGVLAKVISLPFVGKAATAVTVAAMATAGSQLGGIFGGSEPPPSAAPGISAVAAPEASAEGVARSVPGAKVPASPAPGTATADTDDPAAVTGDGGQGQLVVAAPTDEKAKDERKRRSDDDAADDEPAATDDIRQIVTTEGPVEAPPVEAPPVVEPQAELPVIAADEGATADLPVIGLEPEATPVQDPAPSGASDPGVLPVIGDEPTP